MQIATKERQRALPAGAPHCVGSQWAPATECWRRTDDPATSSRAARSRNQRSRSNDEPAVLFPRIRGQRLVKNEENCVQFGIRIVSRRGPQVFFPRNSMMQLCRELLQSGGAQVFFPRISMMQLCRELSQSGGALLHSCFCHVDDQFRIKANKLVLTHCPS